MRVIMSLFHYASDIQWTKLKSQPICLYLDEVVVEMETCEDPRNPQTTSPMAGYSAGGHYGFAEHIIDGMFLSINSVVVNFKANAFAASFQMSRIVIESKTPTWQKGNLRMTRIKDDARGEILLFKEAEWQTLRIEANALEGSDCDLNTTPLRLIANQSKIRITMKKRLIDCGIVTSRLQVNLDDLLWVLTDSQLKAALVFINSLKDVIKKSSQQSKLHAAEKLKKQTPSPTHGTTAQQPKPAQAISQLFTKYDITETSYHLHTGRIDLHLCDDAAPDEEYKRKVEGGALQVTLYKLSLDHYPFHVAGELPYCSTLSCVINSS
ncbi:UHRF1-binding protein 1-like [Lamellibrachia satsuma]|nr:UHRF1-binding protein 1-like [Lamellibrachia satsuma]